MLLLADGFADQPWWVYLLSAISLFVAWIGLLVVRFVIRLARAIDRLPQEIEAAARECVLNAGIALQGAEVTVHAVTAVGPPVGPSPYDPVAEDDDFMPELDGEAWSDDDANFYLIDATITPTNPAATWDPTVLSVVPENFLPEDPTDLCSQMGALHSAEWFHGDRFEPLIAGERTGSQRLRLLFGIPNGLREVKLSLHVTHAGRISLPTPLAKATLAGNR